MVSKNDARLGFNRATRYGSNAMKLTYKNPSSITYGCD